MKKLIAFLLALIMAATSIPLVGIVSLAAQTDPAQQRAAEVFSVGNVVKFGRFPQWRVTKKSTVGFLKQLADSDFTDNRVTLIDGKTYYRKGKNYFYQSYIDWIIVGETDNSYLLLSKSILDWRAFGGGFWHESDIRDWLNGEFYLHSFSETEKKEIVKTTNLTSYHPYEDAYINRKDPHNVTTEDNVFLLDRDQAEALTVEERMAVGTEFCGKTGVVSRWYVRGPARWNYGSLQERFIEPNGEVGAWYGTWSYGIRPAVKVNKDYIIRSQSGIPADEMDELIDDFGTDNDYEADVSFSNDAHINKKTNSVYVRFSRSMFGTRSNREYYHPLAKFCAAFAMLGYKDYVDGILREFGFEVLFWEPDAKRDSVNTFIAAKTITVNEQKRNLIFVGTIGSNKDQWYSDFDPRGKDRIENGKKGYAGNGELDKVHLGFADAREYAYQKLKEQISLYGLDAMPENNIFLFTGHSRGAAAANILAAKVINEGKWVREDSVFAYTFATPNAVNAKEITGIHGMRYQSIFNILNPEDFVTKVMLKGWGYDRYGRDIVLPSVTNTPWNEYQDLLRRMNIEYRCYKEGAEYAPYPLGEANTWGMVNLMNQNVPTVDAFYKKPFFYLNAILLLEPPYVFFTNTVISVMASLDKDLSFNKAYGMGSGITQMAGVLVNPAAVFYGSFLRYFLGFSLNELISYDKFVNGGLKNLLYFGNAHTAETYCAYVQSMSEEELVNTQRASKIGAVNCPVDVEIFDSKTGELVGRIKDNRVDEEIAAKENAVVMFVEGDEKRFWLPSGGDYKVVLTGNDSGTMDYTVSSVEGGDETTERLNYYDVDVSTGVSLTEEIGSALLDSRLLDAAGKEITPDEVITDASEAKANVTVTTEGSGEVKGVGEYIRGDYVTLTARAMCSDFLGWYDGETLVSSETEYRFKAVGNVSLAAKFTEGSHAFEEVTEEATCMVGGYTANRCGNCGLTNILKETKPLGHKTVFNRGQQPTCTENGWKDYYTCSRCEYTTYTEIPAAGHDFGEWTVVKTPTAAEAGIEERTCAVCKEKETRAVPKLTPEKPAYTPGDVDGDGEVASGDARLALRASVKLESYAPGSAPFLAADADGNGVIESSDARLILRASVKLETLPAKP